MKKAVLTTLIVFQFGVAGYAQNSLIAPSPSETDFRAALVNPQEQATQTVSKGPSPGRAFLYSLVLPGAGQFYAGSSKMAQIFLGSEGLLWATFLSFRAYGHWKETDYRRYATVHAGIDPDDKDYDYFVAIENYMDIRAYNEAKLQQRAVDEMYPEDDVYSWEWDSEASREDYERMRVASDRAYRRSLFVVGGIVINHIISGIDALRLARKGRATEMSSVHWGAGSLPEGGIYLSMVKRF